MLLTCPQCQNTYQLDDQIYAQQGGALCAQCQIPLIPVDSVGYDQQWQQQGQTTQQQQQQSQEMSKEDAQRMLDALENQEKQTMEKVNEQKVRQQPKKKSDKDW